MTEAEEARIRDIVRTVIREEREQRQDDEFYINRKDLYDVHQRTVGLLGTLDSISSVIGKTIVYSFLVGVAGLVVWVLGRLK